MDAHLFRAALIAAALLSLGASHRTRNFIVSASSPQLAQEIGEHAESFRRDLSLEWLGRELPPWSDPCPIHAQVSPRFGAGGETSFVFIHGRPTSWTMKIYGPHDRVLDSVLPHEITHTIFATHFGQPLPRWADEGACTTVEHISEKAKQHHLLIRYLTTGKGIPFNRMFAMMQYPPEMLPLYAQGFSLAKFLIAQGGRRKYVDYVGEGLQTGDWNAATRKHYGFQDLSDLQLTWNDWVQRGSQPLAAQVAAAQSSATPASFASATMKAKGQTLTPIQPVSQTRGGDIGTVLQNAFASKSTGGSWYARQRDQGKADGSSGSRLVDVRPLSPRGAQRSPAASATAEDSRVTDNTVTRPQPLGGVRQKILEWRRDTAPRAKSSATIQAPPQSGYYLDASRRGGTILR